MSALQREQLSLKVGPIACSDWASGPCGPCEVSALYTFVATRPTAFQLTQTFDILFNSSRASFARRRRKGVHKYHTHSFAQSDQQFLHSLSCGLTETLSLRRHSLPTVLAVTAADSHSNFFTSLQERDLFITLGAFRTYYVLPRFPSSDSQGRCTCCLGAACLDERTSQISNASETMLA